MFKHICAVDWVQGCWKQGCPGGRGAPHCRQAVAAKQYESTKWIHLFSLLFPVLISFCLKVAGLLMCCHNSQSGVSVNKHSTARQNLNKFRRQHQVNEFWETEKGKAGAYTSQRSNIGSMSQKETSRKVSQSSSLCYVEEQQLWLSVLFVRFKFLV